jgi:uncharacterized iron-regulated membrane protein
VSVAESPRDMSDLRARRRNARRRRRRARLDVSLGLLGAIVLLLVSPGLAIAAVVALALIVLCALSVVLERRAGRRSGRKARPGSRNHGAERRRL